MFHVSVPTVFSVKVKMHLDISYYGVRVDICLLLALYHMIVMDPMQEFKAVRAVVYGRIIKFAGFVVTIFIATDVF